MSLFNKSIVSVMWLAARIAGRQIANAIIFFWLAALLGPSDLGIASLGVTLAMFCLPMVSRGIRDAIIQRPELSDDMLESAFLANLGIGFIILVVLAGSAPVAASVFGDPRLIPLSIAAAFIPFMTALSNLHEALLERSFRHKKITAIYLSSSVIGAALAVAAVLADYELWGLVIFNLGSCGGTALMLWITSDWRPRFRPTRAEMKTQLRFAAPLIISQTINTGNQRIVEMIIGALLTPAAVGFFRFGSNFSRLLNQILITPVLRILLPAFARSKAGPAHNLYRVLVLNAAVLFPVFLLAASVLPEFVDTAFDPRWKIGGWVGTVLCYGVFPSLIGPAAYPLLTVHNKGHWTAILSASALVVTVLCVVAGAQFGAVGAAAGFVLRGIFTIPMNLFAVKRALAIPARRVLAAFIPFALLATVMHLGLLFGLRPLLEPLPGAWSIALQILAGLAFYGLGLRLVLPWVTPEQYATFKGMLPGKVRRLF
ncbi:MAG: oligosaccharide flippase family protein [Alteromonadaceae bacterium]|nr:oligosaccharide flippase family protein [Alteromonadaceae bacterium]